jgi:hypothetical protein
MQADSGYGEDDIQMTVSRCTKSGHDSTTYASTGTIELKLTDDTIDFRNARSDFKSFNDVIKKQTREQKAIDRVAWEGERQQRYQKGGHWK